MTRETYTATVDRIVDGDHVVLLLESDDRVVDEAVLPRERAPGLEAGDVVSAVLKDDDVVELHRDETETDRRRRNLRDRFDRLSRRLTGSDDADEDDATDPDDGTPVGNGDELADANGDETSDPDEP